MRWHPCHWFAKKQHCGRYPWLPKVSCVLVTFMVDICKSGPLSASYGGGHISPAGGSVNTLLEVVLRTDLISHSIWGGVNASKIGHTKCTMPVLEIFHRHKQDGYNCPLSMRPFTLFQWGLGVWPEYLTSGLNLCWHSILHKFGQKG